jgi:hypothetical protein
MNPFEGQRQLEVRAEQVVWHLVSAGVLGLLLLLLVVTVALLEAAHGTSEPVEAAPRVARPIIEDEGAVRATLETSQRCEPVAPVAHPLGVTVQTDPPHDRMRVRPSALDARAAGRLDA